MKFGPRKPSIKKRLAARTSPKRYIRHNLGLKAPRGYGWITNPKKAAYNRIYNRTTFPVFGKSKSNGLEGLIILAVIYLTLWALWIIWIVVSYLVMTLIAAINGKNDEAHPMKLELLYRDVKGATSKRVVQVLNYNPTKFNGSMNCYCETRSAVRTFRLDRVIEAVDISTGEIIPNLKELLEQNFIQPESLPSTG